jgi:hypothetical protein
MLIRQNFSMAQGDDMTVSLDINPDVASLVGCNLTFRVYAQQAAVPIGDPLVTKNLDDGLQITDPDYGLLLITFEPADTIDLDPGNYCIECTLYDLEGKRTTVTEGIMTLARTKNPLALP